MKKNHHKLNFVEKMTQTTSDCFALDRTDKKILNLLQENNLITNKMLAEQVNISPPPCYRRVKRLRDLGIVTKDVSIIDPYIIGPCLIVFVSVTLEKQREDMVNYFEHMMSDSPEVRQCYHISGDIDYLLMVHVKDMNHYHDFCRRVFVKEANISMFRSNFCLSRVKYDIKVYLYEE